MNIHHKNMQLLCSQMQTWTQSKLSHHGIYECNFSTFDVKKGQWAALPMHYDWYCQYLEQSLDSAIVQRIQKGTRYWKSDEFFFEKYKRFTDTLKIENPNRIDIVKPFDSGFYVMTVGCEAPLTQQAWYSCEQAMHEIAYEFHKATHYKKNIFLDFDNTNQLNQLSYDRHDKPEAKYHKARYGHVNFTAKEHLYIEYLLRQLTHKQIAAKHSCTETGVRNIYLNIKRKLGNQNMKTATMVDGLINLGIISVCSANLRGKYV
jgi:DNA-binding CsgD family transcriptional regulator